MNVPHRMAHRAGGFTMIELMIAMLLGLIIIGGVIGIFLATQQTYRTNNALGEVQENSRLAFEMLAHDIRSAQLTGCNSKQNVANVLTNRATAWWANWDNAIKGYGSADPAASAVTGPGKQVTGTDSIQLLGAADTQMSISTHTPASGQFAINGVIGSLQNGDIVIVCDPDHAAILKITSAGPPITYNATATGNCTTDLSYPTNCSSTGTYTFGANAQIAPLSAVDWYIGNNSGGGTSLYRMTLVNTGGTPTPTAQEIVRNVTDMTLSYLQQDATQFQSAQEITDWTTVNAVQVQLTMQSTFQRAGTDNQPITRTYTAIITLYNRVN
jgi:type IV pilus assembly protein PilW